MEKIKILELFSGYGSQKLALDYLGIPCESTQCEIDKYAVDAYNQIHGETENLGDICRVDETKLPYYDLITYSSPCQDFSVAGLQKGGDKDSGTRSSLLWECERIIKAVKPKYLLMENVKNLVGKQHKHNFIAWLDTLDALGYNNYWQVLNAKDYGVPQNRERVFVVSIRKDIQQGYTFPEKIPLEKRLKDILEDSVDEKYYLSDKMVENLFKERDGLNYKPAINKDIAVTLTTKAGQRNSDNYIQEPILIGGMQKNQSIKQDGIATCLTSSMGTGGGYVTMVIEPLACASRGRNPENPSDRTVGAPTEQRLEINESGCANTLTSVQKDNWVIEPNVIQLGNIVETGNWDNPQRGHIYSAEGCSPALSTMQGGGLEPKIVNNYRIRKLTPRECWRLQGVKDEDFNKLHDISNTQLYKMAGNSIVADVLVAIFRNLFINKTEYVKKGNLFNL